MGLVVVVVVVNVVVGVGWREWRELGLIERLVEDWGKGRGKGLVEGSVCGGFSRSSSALLFFSRALFDEAVVAVG